MVVSITDVISIGQLIAGIVQDVQANKQQCNRLAARIGVMIKQLESLQKLPPQQAERLSAPVQELYNVLNEALSLVQEHAAAAWWKRAFQLGSAKLQFEDINSRIADKVKNLELRLHEVSLRTTISFISDYKQDVKDQEQDRHDLLSRQDLIIQKVGGLHDQALLLEDLVNRKFASLRHHFQQVIERDRENNRANETPESIQKLLMKRDNSWDGSPLEKPDEQLVEIPFHELCFQRQIGCGAFGTVYLAEWTKAKIMTAVKVLHVRHLSPNTHAAFVREARSMYRLKEPNQSDCENLLRMHGVCIEPSNYCLVLEYADYGALFHHLYSEVDIPMFYRLQWALGIAKGMRALHSRDQPIIHRDLKSLNVLINKNHQAIICDFGFATARLETVLSSSGVQALAGPVGTRHWMAPEVMSAKPRYSTYSDMYSVAIVFYEIFCRRIPFYESDPLELRDAVKAGERDEIPAFVPQWMRTLIEELWHDDFKKRPSADETVKRIEAHIQDFKQEPIYLSPPITPRRGVSAPLQETTGVNETAVTTESSLLSSMSPLLGAVMLNDVDAARSALESGSSVDECDEEDTPALVLAALKGHAAIIELLLSRNANIKAKDQHGNTALLSAAFNGHLDAVRVLVAGGASLDERNTTGATALLRSTWKGHLEVSKFLVQCGARLDEKNSKGLTPLLRAAEQGHLTLLRWLIDECRASIADRDNDGNTALLGACWSGHLPTVQYLISKGAKVSERNSIGLSPLLCAAYSGNLELVKWLVSSTSSSLAERDSEDTTALLCAAFGGHTELCEWLVAHSGPAIVQQRTITGATALSLAVDGAKRSNDGLQLYEWFLEKHSDKFSAADKEHAQQLFQKKRQQIRFA